MMNRLEARFRNPVSLLWIWIGERAHYVIALIAYVFVTIVYTWPLAANFTTRVNGNVFDVYHELWYLYFDFTQPYGPFFHLWTNLILYPYGVPMYFQVVSPLHAIIGAPIYQFFGLIVAYNFDYMVTFFVSALTMYILVNYLTKNKYAAFFAGLAFGFAPVHTAQALSHLNIMASEMLPLFPYFLIKMVRESSRRNAIYAGIVIALNAMLDLHFLLLSVIIVISFAIYYVLFMWRQVINKPFIIRFTMMWAVAIMIGAVAYFQTLYGLVFASKTQGVLSAETALAHTARVPDVLQFFLPAPQNPFLGPYTYQYYLNFGAFQDINTYFGYTVLALAIVGIIMNYRKREVLFWAFLAAVAYLIALGPQITVNGNPTGLEGVWAYLDVLIPLFRSFRTPFRIDYDVALALAVLAGYGLAGILSSSRWKRRGGSARASRATKILVVAVLCGLLLFEFFPAPYPELDASIPPFYTNVLANDHSNFAVLDVPAVTSNKVYSYWQSAYNKPTVNGHISRTPTSSLIFLTSTPFVEQLGTFLTGTKNGKGPQDIVNQTIIPEKIAPFILAQYNIKYVIIHKDLMPPVVTNSTIDFVTGALGFPIYQDSRIVAYRIDPASVGGIAQFAAAANMSYVATLFGGWNSFGAVGKNARSMDITAGLNVYSPTEQYMQLRFMGEGATGSYHLKTMLNGQTIGNFYLVNGTYAVQSTPYLHLRQGWNQITFNSLEGCSAKAPGLSTAGLQGRQICASVQFYWIALVPSGPA